MTNNNILTNDQINVNNWLYEGKELVPENIPEKAIGFIYIITHPDGRRYIGKKLLTRAATKVVNGKKKKIRKPSDWENYWSSSPFLIEEIERLGTSGFKREIVMFAYSKMLLNYAEETLQNRLGVLESDEWINTNIRSKIFKRFIIGKPELADISSLSISLK